MRACAYKRPPCPFHSRRSKIRGTAELRHKRFAIEGFKFDSTGLSDESTAHLGRISSQTAQRSTAIYRFYFEALEAVALTRRLSPAYFFLFDPALHSLFFNLTVAPASLSKNATRLCFGGHSHVKLQLVFSEQTFAILS